MRPQLRKKDPDEESSPGPSRLTNGRPPPQDKNQEHSSSLEEIVTVNVLDYPIKNEPPSDEDIDAVTMEIDYEIKEETPSDGDMEQIVTVTVQDEHPSNEEMEPVTVEIVQDYLIKNEPPTDDDLEAITTENVQDINDDPPTDSDMEAITTENVQDIQYEPNSGEELDGFDFCPCANLLTGLPIPAMPQLTRIQPIHNPPPLIQLGSQEPQESAAGGNDDERLGDEENFEDEASDSDESEYSEYASTTEGDFHPDSVVVEGGRKGVKVSLDKVPAKSVLRPRSLSRDHYTLPGNFFEVVEYKKKLRNKPSLNDLHREMESYRKRKRRDSVPEPSASNIDTEFNNDNDPDDKNRRRSSLELNASQEGEDERNSQRRDSLPEPSAGNCHKKRVTWVEDPVVFMINPLKNCVYKEPRRTRASESEVETMQPRPPPPPLKRCASVDEIFVKRQRVCCEHTKKERAALRRQWQAATWLQQAAHPEPNEEMEMPLEQVQPDIGEASAHPEQYEEGVKMSFDHIQLQPDIDGASAHPELDEQPEIAEAPAHPSNEEPVVSEMTKPTGSMSPADKINATSSIPSSTLEDEKSKKAQEAKGPTDKMKSKSPTPKELPGLISLTKIRGKSPKPQEMPALIKLPDPIKAKSPKRASESKADPIKAKLPKPASESKGADPIKAYLPKPASESKGTDHIMAKSPKRASESKGTDPIKAKLPKPASESKGADPIKANLPKPASESKGTDPITANLPKPASESKGTDPIKANLPKPASESKGTDPIEAPLPKPSAKPVDPPEKSHDSSKHRGRDHESSKHSCSRHGHSSHHKSHSKSSSSSTSKPDKDVKASCPRHSSHSCCSHHRSHSRSHHCSKHGHRARSYHVRTQVDPADLAASFTETLSEEAKAKKAQQQTPRVPWFPHLATAKLKYGQYFRIVKCPNGGATTCHVYKDEIAHLDDAAQKELAKEFISLSFSEDADGNAHHVLGVVHGGAQDLPDMVEYFADHYGHLPVKVGSLKGPGTESSTMAEFRDGVYKTYSNGTFRSGYLQEVSLCGIRGEECGGYFPDFIRRLELNSFLVGIMPWGPLSALDASSPLLSNDGPIFWVRPGEQTIPSTGSARARSNKGACRFSEERAKLFEDRTKPHGDHSGSYEDTGIEPVCAVGVLKAVTCGNKEHEERETKDVICFSAKEYHHLQDVIQIDVFDPPQSQCTQWLDIGKLNMMKRLNIGFAHLKLEANCIYLIPRKVIHQFQTTSAVSSIAWHARYHEHSKSVNLVQGVPPNKGVVYNEKTDVPKYTPPMPDETDENEEETFAKSTPRKKYRRRSEGESKTDEKKAKKTPAKSHTPIKQMKAATESLKPESLTSAKSHTPTKPIKPIGESLKPTTVPTELSGAVTTNGDKAHSYPSSSGAKKPDGKKPSEAAGAPEKKTNDKTESGKPPLKRPADAPNDTRKIKKKKENPDVVSSILAMMDKKKEF